MAKTPTQRPATRDPGAAGGSTGAVPIMGVGDTFREIGVSGLRAFSGWVREEFLPQLVGRQAATVYREMRDNSPTIGAILFAIEGVMRKVEWRTQAPDDSAGSQQYVEFVDSLREDMSSTWDEFVTEALSMLTYGYAPHEICYKRRNGPQKYRANTPTSQFNDGLIGWDKLPLRGQDTILKWYFDPNGKVLGFQQQPWVGSLLDTPMEKALLFRPTNLKGNPEGRALDPETLIPTPDGWRRLDDLVPGSKVFDEAGRIRYVTARADWYDRPCYRVTFGDGTEIIADANHQWVTTTVKERNLRQGPKLRTTEQIAARVKSSQGSSNHGIAWGEALDYPAQVLPVDPYVLGLWLGDGTSRSASITCHADDLDETVALVETAGYPTSVMQNGKSDSLGRLIRFYGSNGKWASDGPSAAMRVLGVMENKHVPDAYLRGSIEQRKAILAGLMDSDGYVDHTGRCEFCNVNYAIASGVAELVRSLGIGARISSKINSHGNTSWLVKFTPTWAPFRLTRKRARCRTERQRMQHYIAVVEPVESRRTVCIEVDSPSHMFLAGENMVPTHNSVLRNSYLPYYNIKKLQELEAILYERMSGFPVAKIPMALVEAATANPPDPNAASLYAAIKRAVTNVRINEQMGLVLPSDVFRSDTGTGTAPMYSFELITPQGGRQNLDANTPISRYKLDILTSVLADFIMLGHEQRGTQSLAVTKVDLFMQGTEGWLNSVAAVINRYALPRLWDLNGFDPATMPCMVPDLAQRIDLDVLSNFVLRMSQAGMPLFPDEDLEHFIRDSAGMPDISDEGAAMRDLVLQMKQTEADTADQNLQNMSAEQKAQKYDTLRAVIAKALHKRQQHIGGSA